MQAVEELQRLGFELIPEPPDTIRLRWPAGPEPPEAPALIEDLRTNKAAAIAELTRWNEARERERLNRTMNRCNGSARETGSWAEAWEWVRKARPDLAEAVDEALDAIDATWKAKDAAAHMQACILLQKAVQAAADYGGGREVDRARRRAPAFAQQQKIGS